MTCKRSSLLRFICCVLLTLMAIGLSGCCGRKSRTGKNNKTNKNVDFAESLKKSIEKNKSNTGASTVSDIDIDFIGKLPMRARDERTSELYEKFNYANKMFKNRNYEAALREVDRIQQEINNDPYLKMQTWALAAMIYDKTGKTSRRKRSYSKMIEALEEVKKDSRYKKAYEDGMACKDFAALAAKKGEKKYGVYE